MKFFAALVSLTWWCSTNLEQEGSDRFNLDAHHGKNVVSAANAANDFSPCHIRIYKPSRPCLISSALDDGDG
jgi:hypothetical protein